MKYEYCPNCGSSTLVKHDATYYSCTTCGQDLYNNPRATVAVVFLKGNEALFSKRGIEPNKGKYDFPGGFIEYAEDPYQACIREIAEETGVNIQRKDMTLLTAYGAEYIPNVSVIDLIFVTTRWQGDFVPADDSAKLEWKPLSFIESNDFVPPYLGLATMLRNFT
ncbi:MAG: NUDIX domain-containing protein [Candidatus Saccharimonadales bacterium]